MTIKKYSANERIFQQGMRGEWAGIVREGKVEIYIQDDNVDSQTLQDEDRATVCMYRALSHS